MAVADRDLFLFTESPAGWGSAVYTDEWTADKRVDGINYLNRSYLGCESGTDALAYTTGGAVTDVVPLIGGGILAVNKDILAVGGNAILPNVVLFTDPFTHTFYKVTGTCGANADVAGAGTVTATTAIFEADMEGSILYNTTDGAMVYITDWTSSTVVSTDGTTSGWDNDTIYVIKNRFFLDGACAGMKGYGGNFVAFDQDNMYLFNPAIPSDSDKKPGFGCANYRSVQSVGGHLIWVSWDGIYKWDGQSRPVDISTRVKDRVDGYGIWDLIDKSKMNEICSGVKDAEGEYHLSVGTLSTLSGAPASAQANTVLVYNVYRDEWTTRSYPDKFVAYSSFINSSGVKDLYAIGQGDAGVWKLDTGTTDDDAAGTATAISVDLRTPHIVLNSHHEYVTRIAYYLIKYSAVATVAVTDSVNRGTYTTVGTLPISTSSRVIEVKPAANRWGTSHSLKFVTTGKFELESYTMVYEEKMTTQLPRV